MNFFDEFVDITRTHAELHGVTYCPNVDRICPYCDAKHQASTLACSRCANKLASGDSRS